MCSDLSRTSGAKCGRYLEATAAFKHGDDVVDAEFLPASKAERMRRRQCVARNREDWVYRNDGKLAPASVSRHPGRRRVPAKPTPNRSPNVLCLRVVSGSGVDAQRALSIEGDRGQAESRSDYSTESPKYSTRHKVSRIVFAIQESGYCEVHGCNRCKRDRHRRQLRACLSVSSWLSKSKPSTRQRA